MADCDDLCIVTPVDDTAENCPVLTKTRVVSTHKGKQSTIHWELRGPDGLPVDISSCGVAVKVRFADALSDGGGTVYEVAGAILDAAIGTISVTIPVEVANFSGMYQMTWGVFDVDDTLVYVNNGLLTVERSLFGDLSQTSGPPTLMEIRMTLRDTAIENSLLDEVEFDDAEIIYALKRPIQEFNDTPPPLAHFTGQNFPFQHHWLQATAGYLLQIAAHHYRRNKLNVAHGGLDLRDRDRDNPYLQMSELLLQEWRDWMLRQKVSINTTMAWSTLGSDYD